MVVSEVLSVEVMFHFTFMTMVCKIFFLFQIHGSDRFVLGFL